MTFSLYSLKAIKEKEIKKQEMPQLHCGLLMTKNVVRLTLKCKEIER